MDELIIKSNTLIEQQKRVLSTVEQKIILMLIAKLEQTREPIQRFTIQEFQEATGVDDSRKYIEIPKLTFNLMRKVFEIKDENKILQLSWFSSVEYLKGSGIVETEISSKLIPYLLDLDKNFTKYKLKNVIGLRSKYAIRLYELLKMNQFKGKYETTVEEFRVNMDCVDIFSKYSDLKRKVILKGIEEINSNTDINITFKELKTSRKITDLIFYITAKTKDNKVVHKESKKDNKQQQKAFNNFEARPIYKDKDRMKELEEKLLGWE